MTLLHSILCAVPLCVYSSVHVSISIFHKIDKEFKSFLRGHAPDPRAFHPIAWSQVCTPKSKDGLGFQISTQRRLQCNCKLAAQLVLNPNTLWAQVVRAKYKFKGSWLHYTCPRKSSAIWWKIAQAGDPIKFQF